MSWQEAKNLFGRIVNRVLKVVTRSRRPAAVILSKETYQRLTRPQEDLATLLRRSLLLGLDLETKRETLPPSDVNLEP